MRKYLIKVSGEIKVYTRVLVEAESEEEAIDDASDRASTYPHEFRWDREKGTWAEEQKWPDDCPVGLLGEIILTGEEVTR